MAGKGYDFYRRQYHDVSGNTSVAAADTATVTLAALKAGHTIYVQEIIVDILTDAAQTLEFKDDAGTPKKIQKTDASPGAQTHYHWQFGPEGIPLTAAKAFVMVISGAGLAANVAWSAYQRQTSVGYVNSAVTGGPSYL